MKAYFDIIGLVFSGSALVLSVLAYSRTIISTYLEFLKDGDSEEQKDYRKTVYSIGERKTAQLEPRSEEETKAAKVVSFYDKWAIVYEHHYLPRWTFQGEVGYVANKMYNILEPYILKRRQDNNPAYGKAFEKLVKKIKKQSTTI